MIAYDSASFAAGRNSGTRLAACTARLAALELIDHSSWWNRRKHRLMAGALVACAEELEGAAEADRGCDGLEEESTPAPSALALLS